MIKRPSDLEKDFKEFLSAPKASVPESVSSAVFSQIRSDLEPSSSRVFLSLVLVQVLAGTATLLVCPQFGVGPLGGGHGLMAWFMEAGDVGCAIFCGSFFLSAGSLASQFVLSSEILRAIRKHRFRQFFQLGGFAVAVGMVMSGWFADKEVLNLLTYGLAWWVGGALIAAEAYRWFWLGRQRFLWEFGKRGNS